MSKSYFEFKNLQNPIQISKGAFGIVHKVNDSQTNRDFAVKTITALDEKDRLKIEKEIEIWEKLSSLKCKPRSIPNFYGSRRENFAIAGFKYDLVFDVFPKSLDKVISKLKNSDPLPFKQIYNYYKSLVSSLAFLQTMKVCHRDLKPANLLLDEEEENIFLIDFSESKEIIIEAPDETKKELTIAGSVKYFSPELYFDYNNQSRNVKLNPYKSDVFSLGLIILEMGIGKIPKKKNDQKEWKRNIDGKIDEFKKIYKETLETSYERKIFRNLLTNLEECLELDPSDRPDFKKLFTSLLNDSDDETFRNHILLEEGQNFSLKNQFENEKITNEKDKINKSTPQDRIMKSEMREHAKMMEMNKNEHAYTVSVLNDKRKNKEFYEEKNISKAKSCNFNDSNKSIYYFSKKKKEFLESNDFLLIWQFKQDIDVKISGKSAKSTDKIIVHDGRYSLNIFLSEKMIVN